MTEATQLRAIKLIVRINEEFLFHKNYYYNKILQVYQTLNHRSCSIIRSGFTDTEVPRLSKPPRGDTFCSDNQRVQINVGVFANNLNNTQRLETLNNFGEYREPLNRGSDN